jgi:hypothetical protein
MGSEINEQQLFSLKDRGKEQREGKVGKTNERGEKQRGGRARGREGVRGGGRETLKISKDVF